MSIFYIGFVRCPKCKKLHTICITPKVDCPCGHSFLVYDVA